MEISDRMVGRILATVMLVLAVIYIVPFAVYGTFSALTGLKPPAGVSPAQFLVSVLVSKVGTAVGFVVIFYLARSSLGRRWIIYAFVWWLMLAIGEIGQAIGPNYSRQEAIAGVISEMIYFPLAAWITHRFLGLSG